MRLTDFLQSIGRPIAYYPALNRITGGVLPTLLLCQFIYWSDKGMERDGWIWKTRQELSYETGLTRWEQERARQALRQRGFLKEKFAGMPRRLYFQVQHEAINAAWECRRGRLHLGEGSYPQGSGRENTP
jgi:hypothetical protein